MKVGEENTENKRVRWDPVQSTKVPIKLGEFVKFTCCWVAALRETAGWNICSLWIVQAMRYGGSRLWTDLWNHVGGWGLPRCSTAGQEVHHPVLTVQGTALKAGYLWVLCMPFVVILAALSFHRMLLTVLLPGRRQFVLFRNSRIWFTGCIRPAVTS